MVLVIMEWQVGREFCSLFPHPFSLEREAPFVPAELSGIFGFGVQIFPEILMDVA